jgi:DNA-directed RNA polymerase subunit RPC12/RpoP
MQKEKTSKEKYLEMRERGYSNKGIAEFYKVKESTVDRAIGKNKKESTGNMNTDTMDFFDDFEETSEETTINESVRELKKITCIDCGKEFDFSPAEQKFYESRGFDTPKRCPECRDKRKQTVDIECVDCGKTFQMRLTEKEYYEKNGLYIPKRCPSCRELKRKHNESKEAGK